MAAQSDVKEIDQEGAVSPKRRFDQRDWDYLAQFGHEEFMRRKEARRDREREWGEIDRQIRMEPELAFKKLANGSIDPKKRWMAEVEMPLQAQAVEVLTSDSARLRGLDTATWFKAHAETTDEYYQRVNFESIIMGDQTEVPSHINQDNADKLVGGFLLNLFRQTDFPTRVKRIDAEAFKYGMGIGRARMETKSVYINEARGVLKDNKKLPVLVPCSIKNVYLDEPMPSMHSSQVLGPMDISEDWIKLANIQLAANVGSTDPDKEDGGWMPKQFSKLIEDKNGYVKVIELEGDIVIPRKTTRSMVIPGAIVTIAVGDKDKGGSVSRAVIRFRFRKYPFSTYLQFPYHYEGANDAYPTSPLMKGRPIQMLATDAANRLLDSAMLKLAPPVGYDRSDTVFAQKGGPVIEPFAQWGTLDGIKVHEEVGGDPTSLLAMFEKALTLHAELTGVLPARLGAQTVSHTTAYAKDAEIQRGAARTVAYVNQTGEGTMVRWLDMAYRMGRDSLKANEKTSFFIAEYGGFVEIDKSHLPDCVTFDWLGSGGPGDENQKQQAKVNSVLLAAKLDAINMQTGKPPHLNINSTIDEVLREGGWTDIDPITNHDPVAGANAGPGAAVAALQNLTLPQPQ